MEPGGAQALSDALFLRKLRRKIDIDDEVHIAFDLDPPTGFSRNVHLGLEPSLLDVVHVPDLLLDDLGSLPGRSRMSVVVQGDRPFLDDAHRGLDGLVGQNEVVRSLVGDDSAAQTFGDHVDRLVPTTRKKIRIRIVLRLVRRLAQIHDFSHDCL